MNEIKMKSGYDITEEIIKLVNNYDFNYMYIEDSGQRKKASYKNSDIRIKLKELNVVEFKGIIL